MLLLLFGRSMMVIIMIIFVLELSFAFDGLGDHGEETGVNGQVRPEVRTDGQAFEGDNGTIAGIVVRMDFRRCGGQRRSLGFRRLARRRVDERIEDGGILQTQNFVIGIIIGHVHEGTDGVMLVGSVTQIGESVENPMVPGQKAPILRQARLETENGRHIPS